MARTTSGNDMTAVASAAPVLVNASWMPKCLVQPAADGAAHAEQHQQ